MLGSNVCWGIDIGSSSIKAAKISKTKGGLEITGLDLIELETKGPEEESQREEQVREALNVLKSRNKIKNEPIFVSIPGQGTYNRTISLPPVEKKRIKEIVKYEAQQQIPFPIEEVIWDYHPVGGDDEVAGELEVSLFAVKREVIHNFMSTLRACDMQPEGIQVAPIALYNFIRFDMQIAEPTVVIDIGAENSDLIVIDGERLWMRSLQIAGNEITRELQKKFQIPFEEAEKLKLKAKKSKQAKKIFNIIRPILKDMVNEIHRSVGYYKSLAKGVKFEKMVFLGNSTKLMGFKRFFSQNLQYQVDVFSGIQRIHVSNKVNVNMLNQNVTSFGVALGLAIQGVGEANNNIRLIPPEIKKRQEVVKKKPWFVGVTAVLGLMVVVVGVLDFLKKSSAENLPVGPTGGTDWITQIDRWDRDLEKAKGAEVQHLERQKDLLSIFGRQREVMPAFLAKVRTLVPEANDVDLENARPQDKVWLLDVKFERTVQEMERWSTPQGGAGLRQPEMGQSTEEYSPLDRYLPVYQGTVILAVASKDESGQDRVGEIVFKERIKKELEKDPPANPAEDSMFFRKVVFADPGTRELRPEYRKALDALADRGVNAEQAKEMYWRLLGDFDRKIWSSVGKPAAEHFDLPGKPYFPKSSTLAPPDSNAPRSGFPADGQGEKYLLMKVGLGYEFPYQETYHATVTSGTEASELLGKVVNGSKLVEDGFVRSVSGNDVDLMLFVANTDVSVQDEPVDRDALVKEIEAALEGGQFQAEKSSARKLVFVKQ